MFIILTEWASVSAADLNRSADVGDNTTSVGILTYGLYAVADRFVSRAAA